MKKDFAKGAALGVLAGAIAGAVAGILLAPKSGKETRKDIANYLSEIKDKIAVELEKAGDFTKEKYNQVVSKTIATYETAKKLTSEQAEEIKKDLEENYEKVKKASKKK